MVNIVVAVVIGAIEVAIVLFKVAIWLLMRLYSVSAQGLPALLIVLAIVLASVILGLLVLGLVFSIILSQGTFLG